MKKRHFLLIAALSAFAVLTSSIAVATTTSGALNADATETTYTLSINKDNFEKVGKTSTHIAKTASNYDLKFEVTPEFTPIEGGIGTFKQGTTIRNLSKIKGLKKVTIVDNNDTQENAYRIHMGYDNGGEIKLCTVQYFNKTFDTSHLTPTYIELVTLRDVTINSIKLEYSCNETPIPSRFTYPCSIDIVNAESIPMELDKFSDNTTNLTYHIKDAHLEKGWRFYIFHINTDTNVHFQFMANAFGRDYGTAFYSHDVEGQDMNEIVVNKTGDYEIYFTFFPLDKYQVSGRGHIGAISHVPVPSTLYAKINTTWTEANPRYAVYTFLNGTDDVNAWFDGTLVDAKQQIYKFDIKNPEKYDSVIVCRMNPGAKANNWDNKWNQTVDIHASSDLAHNYLTLGEGWNPQATWSTYGA